MGLNNQYGTKPFCNLPQTPQVKDPYIDELRSNFSRKPLLPGMVWVVLLSTVIVLLVGYLQIGKYTVKGFGWIIPMAFAIASIMKTKVVEKTMLLIWLPWMIVIASYQIFATAPNSLHHSLMFLSPIIVGIAISNLSISEYQLENLYHALKYISVCFLVIVSFKTGLLITGKLPTMGSYAADVMTASLLCTVFVARFVLVDRSALKWWMLSICIPIIALTRMAIAVCLSTIPLSFSPVKRKTRLLLSFLIFVMAISLFYTDRMQQRMFFSGKGELKDLFWENPDLKTNSRKYIWDNMKHEVLKKPLWGHGTNTSEFFVSIITFGTVLHPHNDWLRLTYDYGFFGTIIFLICISIQILHLLRSCKNITNTRIKAVFFASASSFMNTILFMFTDNIVLYAAFYGNLQFLLVGMAYAIVRKE